MFAAGVEPHNLQTNGCPSFPAGAGPTASVLKGAAGAASVGVAEGVALLGGTPPASRWAVRRAASAAAWLSWPRRASLTAALTAASWIISLPPISRRTQLVQHFRA